LLTIDERTKWKRNVQIIMLYRGVMTDGIHGCGTESQEVQLFDLNLDTIPFDDFAFASHVRDRSVSS